MKIGICDDNLMVCQQISRVIERYKEDNLFELEDPPIWFWVFLVLIGTGLIIIYFYIMQKEKDKHMLQEEDCKKK